MWSGCCYSLLLLALSQLTAASVSITSTTTTAIPQVTTTLGAGSQVAPATSGQGARSTIQSSKKQRENNGQCQYERLPWEQCQANGVQQRLLKLKRTKGAQAARCEPIKIVRRECKPGCKYQRGEWSSECLDGLRVRVDTLARAPRQAAGCEPLRRVTKDCAHTCHYVKSAWSECLDGVRTRSLRLSQSLKHGAGCLREKTVKRACRAPAASKELRRPKTGKTTNAGEAVEGVNKA